MQLDIYFYNKFWEELIAYFPLIHGPQRKRRLQQFFAAAGTSLPSCYLATMRGYTDRPTGPRVQQVFYIVACIRWSGNVFSDPLPSINGRIHFIELLLPHDDRRDRHIDKQTDGRDLWSTPMGLAQLPYIPSFIKIGSGIQKDGDRINWRI
jgi:hypothetical protein